ncbi:ABC transporter permease [Leifsonia sp. 2TAF2]|uniref:ABC transporter permease n=1 Tax=Leifsonia sp. 2TAF2 TaxID=3233009 RepID=UPI003F9BF4DE
MGWIISNISLIGELTLNHVLLSIPPILIGFVAAVPLGWLASRWKPWRSIIVGGGSLLYTIPSLPLFVILPYVLGTRITDPVNIVVALTIYAVAVMVRSASDAFASVPADTVEAATAVGHSRRSLFWAVELPLAGPVLLAGIRVVSASTVALVSVGALVGSANLGYLFTDGMQRQFFEEILVGVIASLVIALAFDTILVLIGRSLMRWPQPMQRLQRKASLVIVERGA